MLLRCYLDDDIRALSLMDTVVVGFGCLLPAELTTEGVWS